MSGGSSDPVQTVTSGGLNLVTGGGKNSLPNQILGTLTGANAAEIQGQMAQAQLAAQEQQRKDALHAAAASPQEIAQLESAIALNQQDMSRKQKLLDSSDPALIEAGHQALSLLQGKNSPVLAPIMAQQQLQRQQLQSKLKAQLGDGWQTSTAGQQAMADFDRQSGLGLAGAQQSSLAQMLGIAQDTSGRYGMQNNIANMGSFSNAYAGQSARNVAAINGSPINAAGAQYVGDLSAARGMQSLANMGLGAGISAFSGMPSSTASSAGGGAMSPTASSGYRGNGGNYV